MLLPQSYQYPNLSEGADRVGGQLRGDKKCPFSGVTNSGRVWRKVSESDARSEPEFQIWAAEKQNARLPCCFILKVGMRKVLSSEEDRRDLEGT